MNETRKPAAIADTFKSIAYDAQTLAQYAANNDAEHVKIYAAYISQALAAIDALSK